jgi:hypothetical protein
MERTPHFILNRLHSFVGTTRNTQALTWTALTKESTAVSKAESEAAALLLATAAAGAAPSSAIADGAAARRAAAVAATRLAAGWALAA